MAMLICSGLTSLDGLLNDADGRFDWAAPDAEVHQFVNDRERAVGTYLYGRRMYEVMSYWENVGSGADESRVERDYARTWQAADKIVYSTTLSDVDTARLHGAIVRGYDATLVADGHTTEDLSDYGAPTPDLVIAHTNLLWQQHRAPGRTAATVTATELDFGPRP